MKISAQVCNSTESPDTVRCYSSSTNTSKKIYPILDGNARHLFVLRLSIPFLLFVRALFFQVFGGLFLVGFLLVFFC